MSKAMDIPATAEQEADWEQVCEERSFGHDLSEDHIQGIKDGFVDEPAPPMTAPRRLLGTLTSEERKTYPMTTGLLDYFPDALAMVAHISYLGNQKHNPGEPLHWARGKSMDHPDCIMRHLTERYELDPDGVEHSAQLAWRALADLQMALERKYDLDPPRGATPSAPSV